MIPLQLLQKISRQALPESIQNLSFDKHLNISVGYWNIEEMEKAAEPDAMTQYIEDLFNITLEPMAVTWSNYKERLSDFECYRKPS